MKITKNNFLLIMTIAALVFIGITAYFLSNSSTLFQQEIAKLNTQSSSSEIESIEKDILGTDLSGLDKELSEIEEEIEAVY